VQVIYNVAARIYQPGYSGYRGERQEIYLVLEYELSSVADILFYYCAPERTPGQSSFFGGGSGAYVRE
jgi:hypothetical protein